jgi:2,3-bisphosphoglycerate-independent phosphoglycerate mutase
MKALLVIADGLGWTDVAESNAVSPETMPFLFALAKKHGVARLEASGTPVGLGDGQAGNSEAGHLTIGAGRRVPSLLENIGKAYEDGHFERSAVWTALERAPRLHLVGLLSDAGVHGYWPNLVRAADLARRHGVQQVYVHALLDGVDSQAGSAPALLAQLQSAIAPLEGVICATVMGRRWACDRSGDLDLTRVLVDHLRGKAGAEPFTVGVLEDFIAGGGADKDFPCHVLDNHGFIAEAEPVLLTNNRADRTAQVARVFGEGNLVYALVDLDGVVPLERVFFPKQPLEEGVASELQRHGIETVRVAEQCKFPHVTHFFNGFHESLGEEAVCLPSIPEASIPDQPEMSAREITDAVLALLAEPGRRAVVANLANADQVGHTGRMDATRMAVGIVDREIARLHEACQQHGWSLLITSDHGNADVMLDAQERPFGSHSTNPVPLIVVPATAGAQQLASERGSLANVGATFLTALGVEPPSWMEPSLTAPSQQTAEGAAQGSSR